jgi:hypothetical protein
MDVRLSWEDDEIGHATTVPVELAAKEIELIKQAEGTYVNLGNARNFRIGYGHDVQVGDVVVSLTATVPAEAFLSQPDSFELMAVTQGPNSVLLEPLPDERSRQAPEEE